MLLKVCLIALFFTIVQSQFIANNDANSNFFSVAMPHGHVNFQRYFNNAGGQKVIFKFILSKVISDLKT